MAWIFGSLGGAACASVLARRFGHEVLVALVVAATITANVLAVKVIRMFGVLVPAGVVVYSITFLLTDALSEFYGRREAAQAVGLGFLGNLFYLVSLWVVLRWPHGLDASAGQQFSAVMGLSVRVTFASLVAYLFSQFHDVLAYHFWGTRTRGRHLWLRNNASTIVSQAIDTTIFITIAFWGILPIGSLILGQFAVKLVIALMDTPFLYAMRMWVFGVPEYHVFAKAFDTKTRGDT